eukprot:6205026-Pleurochrysis_carterae.AAC.2
MTVRTEIEHSAVCGLESDGPTKCLRMISGSPKHTLMHGSQITEPGPAPMGRRPMSGTYVPQRALSP